METQNVKKTTTVERQKPDVKSLKEEVVLAELDARIAKARYEALVYRIKYFEMLGQVANEQATTNNTTENKETDNK